MSTRPDPNTPETPQEATERRLSAPEGPDGNAETLEGQNGPQTGAQPRGPVDWARHQAAQRATAAAPDETETLKATVGRVRKLAAELFVEGATHTHRAIGRQLLNTLQSPEPDETTPADEARLDRAHWNTKYAGEGQ